jgi:conjugative transposon TraM protein
MATRYAGGGAATQGSFTSDKPYERVKAEAVTPVRHDVVSTLSLPPDDETFVEEYSKPRNYGFLTAAGGAATTGKNSIRAEVYGKTTITGGQDVRLRLLEPVKVGTYIVPAGTLITAQAKIASERLFVSVTSLQHGGNIIPVHLEAYGLDGVRGMFVPGSEELSAASDIAANMGTSLGTSVTISRDATSAIAADLGKSVIQGTSQYIAKKFRTVKVTLRAGHKLLLLPSDQ